MKEPGEAGPESPRVRIKDVAVAAGVSTATVSLAYNNKGEVAAATRKKVLAVGEGLGYQPNPSGRALRTGQTRILGVLVSYRDSPVWQETYLPYYRGIISDAAIEAMDHGYSVVAASPKPGNLAESIAQLDGAIVVDPLDNDAIVDHCAARGIPLVADGGFVGGRRADKQMVVRGDVERYVHDILDLTAQQHHTRTGRPLGSAALFTGSIIDRYTADTEAAFSSWCAANAVDARVTALEPGGAVTEVARRILATDRPEAVYCLNESYSGAIISAARALELGIPDDVLLSSAATSEQAIRDPRVNYVESADAEGPGRRAVRLLVNYLESAVQEDATVAFRLRPAVAPTPLR
ncbi:LacI family DNA-binding transcriptional regulator [Specibacter cremeus]|uniref:LacI family DNA-binding transcriptional regulator n=1 Tax=Specibacter cremeus TaxID=1629051 RepID=UPI000F77A415|nr:LacI family DNA-binding transcriptional regulator [Specibacter cremeus]